jgi:hypothetical protein
LLEQLSREETIALFRKWYGSANLSTVTVQDIQWFRKYLVENGYPGNGIERYIETIIDFI